MSTDHIVGLNEMIGPRPDAGNHFGDITKMVMLAPDKDGSTPSKRCSPTCSPAWLGSRIQGSGFLEGRLPRRPRGLPRIAR